MSTEKLAVGQEVVAVRTNRWTADAPRFIAAGVVTRVARRYATAEVEGRGEFEFDMDTGYRRDDTNGNGIRIMTRAQVEQETRFAAAKEVLKSHRITLEPGCHLTPDQVEAIAAIVHPAQSS